MANDETDFVFRLIEGNYPVDVPREKSDESGDRPAFEEEVVLTPEMVKEGVRLLGEFYGEVDDCFTEERAKSIFKSMLALR